MTLFDWLIIVLYLGGIVAMGAWISRGQHNMEDYFLGGRRIPWGAAMLSMVATEISAATFLGAPEQGYTRDLTYLQFGIGSIVARIVLAFLFLGIFYKLKVFTVYAFLKHRFGFPTRNSAAGAFLLGRLFAGGSRLFIASLAIKVVTGFDMATSIVILGVIAIAYTFMGGIKAVIWTDVVQAIILILGAVLSIAFLLSEIPQSMGGIWDQLAAAGKFRLFDTAGRDSAGHLAMFSNAYHFLPALLGGFFLTMATHGTDQAMIQRLLTCKDSMRGKVSMILSGFVGIGVAFMFIVVGMLLYVYVGSLPLDHEMKQVADSLAAQGQNGHYYLHYIVNNLPPGISGLIIAAVIAAAMSSIDSELNAMSAAAINDFYKPYFQPEGEMSVYLKAARIATVVCGFLLIGFAVLIADFYANNPDTDLLSIALGVMTLFYGALLGVFLVGLLTRRRGSSATNIAGMVISTLLIVVINYKARLLPALGLYDPESGAGGPIAWFYHAPISWPWFIVIGTIVTVGIACLGMTTTDIVDRFQVTRKEADRANLAQGKQTPA